MNNNSRILIGPLPKYIQVNKLAITKNQATTTKNIKSTGIELVNVATKITSELKIKGRLIIANNQYLDFLD